jgi:hypothetical protein
MKRCLCLLVFIALSLILTSGCAQITDWKPTEYDNINNFDGVNMTVKEETVSSTGITVVIENNSEVQCIYSEDFLLEKKIKGKWYQVPVIIESYGFNDIGYELTPGEKGEWSVDWTWLYGSLDAGEYRIVKSVLAFRSTGDFDEYKLAADFNILSK